MHKTSWWVSAAFAWLTVPGCFFVHDSDCTSNSDCKVGRSCSNGACVDSGGPGGGEGATSSAGTNQGTSGSTGSGGSAPSGTPQCTLTSGNFIAANYFDGECSAKMSFPVVVGSNGRLESFDGRACTFAHTDDDNDCFAIGDYYSCDGCMVTVGDDLNDGQYLIGADDCDDPCAAQYCCALGSGSKVSVGYTFGAEGIGGSGTGGSGNNCGAPQSCESCYGACNQSCYDYPMGCLGPCFQACDRCCSPV